MKQKLNFLLDVPKILLELKTKTDAVEANMQLQLNTAETATYNAIEETLSLKITRGIK
jgi:hypothetical protein